MRKAGFCYEDIAKELNTTKGAISQLISRMKKQEQFIDIISSNKWTDEEEEKLIALREEGYDNKEIAELLKKKYDTVKQKASEFIKLGLIERQQQGGQSAGLDKNKVTTLYLLLFKDEGIYKVGVTQRTISLRFSGSPSYEVIDSMVVDLETALEFEKQILTKVNIYKYIPEHFWFERNGKTECFKTTDPINSLEDIFTLA
jgi:hypothetical protein